MMKKWSENALFMRDTLQDEYASIKAILAKK
jgi:hypothetical protein